MKRKRKRKRIFRTAEERAAWEAEGDAIQRAVRERLEVIRAELASRRRKPA